MRALAIVGPTASGKTSLSVPVARRLGAEIVSMDSRQVYRGLDVGTAKADRGIRSAVPHHGIDVVPPGERYSAGRFAREARAWMREIEGRGRVPLLVGGTGFFLRALTDPVFKEPQMEEGRRERLRGWLRGRSRPELSRWVRVLDPDRASVAESGGRQRLSRALEVPLLTGSALSWWHQAAPPAAEPVEAHIVLMELPRKDLYRRIDERVERMFEEGLLDETRGLIAAGVGDEDPGMTAVGYREALAVVRGELDRDEAVDRAQKATRAYARRQLTWFRNQLSGPILTVDARGSPEELADEVLAWWAGTGADARG